MSASEATTPRVYLVRHGETEWAKNGRYTGISEIPLTPHGEEQVAAAGRTLAGAGKLIDPANIAKVFVSPRVRAQQTFEIFFTPQGKAALKEAGKVLDTEKIAEWGYGAYEGKFEHEIRAIRKEHGLDKERAWDVWLDGCEEGESPEQVTKRLDGLIEDIHAIQGPYMNNEKPVDVVLVAHGHILRAFVRRWLKFPLDFNLSLMLEPGGVGVLSYQVHDINQPALFVGLGLPPQDHA